MSNKTIITPWEVVKYNAVDPNIEVNVVGKYIYDVENELAREWIGMDFYRAMLNDAQDFSELQEYSSQVTYSDGSKVIYRGLVFESQLDSNVGVLPNDSTNWLLVNKFSAQAYNDLYNYHLRGYFATEIYNVSSRFLYTQMKSTGLVKRNETKTGAQSVSREEFSDYRKDIEKIAAMKVRNMSQWINDHWEDAAYIVDGESLFKDFAGLSCGSDQLKRVGRRKFFFRKLNSD